MKAVMMVRLQLVLFLLLGQVAHIMASLRMLWAIVNGSPQGRVIAISYDQLANTALNGSEDETISSRAGRARDDGHQWGCTLCRFLDWLFREAHCTISIERRAVRQAIRRMTRKS